MICTEPTKEAMRLCFAAHRDKVGKSGLPYVFRPFRAAEQMTTQETTVATLLHDAVEDTDYTLDGIAATGFPQSVIDALKLLTHDDTVPCMTYVAGTRAIIPFGHSPADAGCGRSLLKQAGKVYDPRNGIVFPYPSYSRLLFFEIRCKIIYHKQERIV